jgi:ArsR family transcriptional regulator
LYNIMKVKNSSKNNTAKEITQSVELLKAIADENRLKILRVLQPGEKCVCEIWKQLRLSQNLVSYHLKTLEDIKLISSHKEGLWVFYKINKKEIAKLNSLLNKF